jgi:hypothetical protein
MYDRETDEATRQVVSCCCVNACSNPHHDQHTSCVSALQYAQNLNLIMPRLIRLVVKSVYEVYQSHQSSVSLMSAILYCYINNFLIKR